MARKYRSQATFIVDGAKLSDARIAMRLSMREVAEALSCNGKKPSKAQISRWEQGKLCPSEDRIRKMIELYGTANFVVAGQGFMERASELLAQEDK